VWTGYYSCVQCEDRFIFQREDVGLPEGLFFQVVHNHDVTPPRWEGSLYKHTKGMRFPAEVKDKKAVIASQKKAIVQAKRIDNNHAREGQN
jgi:hypothetical protein